MYFGDARGDAVRCFVTPSSDYMYKSGDIWRNDCGCCWKITCIGYFVTLQQ